MTKQLLHSTHVLYNKHRNRLFSKFLNSPALKYISWLTVALLVLYRVLMGEWFVLLVYGVGSVLLALLWQHWKAISKRYRGQLLFGLSAVLSWCFFTMHTPAYALFFDTLENGLRTLLARFGVTGLENVPNWIGGIFRIFGIVSLGVLFLRFGRAREDEEEGTKAAVGKIVQVLCGLMIFDLVLGFFLN